jgi:hypothetical protein
MSDFMQESLCTFIEQWSASKLPGMGKLFQTSFIDNFIREVIALHDSKKDNRTVEAYEMTTERVYTLRKSFLKKHNHRIRLNLKAKLTKSRFEACKKENFDEYFKNILDTIYVHETTRWQLQK